MNISFFEAMGDIIEVEFFTYFEAFVDEVDISVAVVGVHRIVKVT